MCRPRSISGWIAILWLIQGSADTHARSTFTAHFESEAVAGPGITQSVKLYLDFFPGDGEAIVRAEIAFEPDAVVLSAIRSTAGNSELYEPGLLVVDYQTAPLGWGSRDTLQIDLVAGIRSADVIWEGEIFSSADVAGAAAHKSVFRLSVQEPVSVDVEWEPKSLLPGVSTSLEVRFRNRDKRGRAVEGISWSWPDWLETDAPEREIWENSLEPDSSLSSTYRVSVTPEAAGSVALKGRAETPELKGSPLRDIVIDIAPVPRASVRTSESFLILGEPADIEYACHNPTADTILIDALEVTVPDGFDDVATSLAKDGTATAKVSSLDDERRAIVVESIGPLAPGEAFTLSVTATPKRTGPYAWVGRFRPQGASDLVRLEGDVTVNVVRPPEADNAKGEETPGGDLFTDLESVRMGLEANLSTALDDLPLQTGDRVTLKSDNKKDDKTWIVEELLTSALLNRDYQVVVGEVAEGSAVLSYRLVDSRAIYSPSGVSWRSMLFQSQTQQRESLGDLFLRLESGVAAGKIRVAWARRIRAYRRDSVPAEGSRWLGASEVVDRSTVYPDNKILELGLSGLIAGGLVLVFFAP